jgi:hypothetical protein
MGCSAAFRHVCLGGLPALRVEYFSDPQGVRSSRRPAPTSETQSTITTALYCSFF